MEPGAITARVSPIVESCGLEVDRVEVLSAGRRRVVRIFLDGDGPQGRGPSLDEIAAATRAISSALDEAPELGSHPWTLEVSSRGVTRPLTQPRHFRRNQGRLVALTLTTGEQFTGRLLEVSEGVRVDVDGMARLLEFAAIDRAVVQVELNRPIDSDQDEDEDEEN